MDYQVTWSPEALRDIEVIADYIARDSMFYARAVVEKIIYMAASLGQFPLKGRVVPEFQDEAIREVFLYEYRIIYQVQNDNVLVITIIHGKRLLDSIKEKVTDNIVPEVH